MKVVILVFFYCYGALLGELYRERIHYELIAVSVVVNVRPHLDLHVTQNRKGARSPTLAGKVPVSR